MAATSIVFSTRTTQMEDTRGSTNRYSQFLTMWASKLEYFNHLLCYYRTSLAPLLENSWRKSLFDLSKCISLIHFAAVLPHQCLWMFLITQLFVLTGYSKNAAFSAMATSPAIVSLKNPRKAPLTSRQEEHLLKAKTVKHFIHCALPRMQCILSQVYCVLGATSKYLIFTFTKTS